MALLQGLGRAPVGELARVVRAAEERVVWGVAVTQKACTCMQMLTWLHQPSIHSCVSHAGTPPARLYGPSTQK